MGFYISKALNTMGNNYTISSDYLSFEKTIYTIFLEYKNRVNSSFLVGEVDSSLENLKKEVDKIKSYTVKNEKIKSLKFIFKKGNNKNNIIMILGMLLQKIFTLLLIQFSPGFIGNLVF